MPQPVRTTSSDRPRVPPFGALAIGLAALVLILTTVLVGPAHAADPTAPSDPTTVPVDPTTVPVDPAAPVAPVAPPIPLPPEPPLPDPSPQIRVLLARLQVISTDRSLSVLTLGVTGARQAETDAAAAVATATQQEADAQQVLDARRDQLGSLAAIAFMRAGGGTMSVLIDGDPTTSTRQQGLFDASIEHHDQLVRDAQTARDLAQDALVAAQRSAEEATARRVDAEALVGQGQADLAGAHRELATASANEARPPSTRPPGRSSARAWTLPLESTSAFTAEELATWYVAQGHGSQASAPMEDLTRFYIDEGSAEGVRGDMAFAQSIQETGFFANSDTIGRNNFAGIGHCEACGGGFVFASAQIGVRAQIQLLKSYAESSPQYNSPRADATLDGPAGCCPNWTDLTGVWASDPNYGPHILNGYQAMLEWLVTYRPTEPLLPPAPVAAPSPPG